MTRTNSTVRRVVAITLVTLALSTATSAGVPSSANAQEPQGDLATVERAHEVYQRGLAAYEIGDYEVAVNAFLASWSMYEDPRLLYNLSLAYWKLGKIDQAVTTATRVIEADVDPGVKMRAHARRAAFGTLGRAQVAASEFQAAEEPDAQAAGQAGQARPWRWVPWATGAVTLGAIIGVAVVDRQIAATVSEMEQAETDGDRSAANALYAEVGRRQLAGRLLLGTAAVGATATVVGIVVQMRADAPQRSRRVEIGFGPTSVTVGARF